MTRSSATTSLSQGTLTPDSGELFANWREHFEDLGTYIWSWNLDDDSVEFSPAWLHLMGYTSHDIRTGDQWFSLIHPDDKPDVMKRTKACLGGENDSFENEFRLRRADGLYQWMHSRAKILRAGALSNHANDVFLGVYVDTSKSHADKIRIKTLEQRWDKALRGTSLGVWEWDIKTGETFFSDEWCSMLDLNPDEITPTIELWRELAHPDDLAKSDKEIAAYLAGERDRYECECRVRTKNGEWKWILDRGTVVERDPDGSPRALIGTHEDISERKRQEHEIQQTSDRIKNVTKAIPGFFYEYRLNADGSDCFPFASASIENVYGLTPEQVKDDASRVANVIHPDDRNAVFESILESAKTGDQWVASYRVILNNETRWLRAVANRATKKTEDGAIVWHGYIVDITEQLSHDQLLAQTIRLIPGAVYQHRRSADGVHTFPFSTAKIKSIYGISSDELKEDASRIFDVVHPDDIDRMREIITASIKNRTGWMAVYRITRDNETRWLREVTNIDDHETTDGSATWYGYVKDITAEKQKELAIADQHQLLQQITGTVPGVLYNYIIHPNGDASISFIGDNVKRIFGVSKEAALEDVSNLWTYIHPEDRQRLEPIVNAAEDLDVTFRVLIPKIGEQWRHVSANCVTDDEGNSTYYAYASDITDRRLKELAIEQQAQDIAIANEDLEQFNYVAAHDLKEPLRAIRNLSNWIFEDLPEDAARLVENNLTRMRDRVDKLQLLVDDLAAYSRAGRQNEDQEKTTNTIRIANKVIEEIEQLVGQIDITEVASIEFATIEVALVTAIKNLLINAIKHHDQAGPVVIKLTVRQANNMLRWTVEDNGPGIPKEHHERIFRMYQRLHPELETEGSGSGLAIVKRIVNAAHGKIQISSPLEGGRGTRFTFTWPLQWPKRPV